MRLAATTRPRPRRFGALSRRFPGTAASGLAHLLAGLRLLDEGRPADAVPHLAHADVQLTLVPDHALFALGRAQEALGQADAAARAYLGAGAGPGGTLACASLPKAAALFARAGQPEAAIPALEQVAASCPREAPEALFGLGEAHLARGDRAAAASAFDRLETEHPTSARAREARARLVGTRRATARALAERARRTPPRARQRSPRCGPHDGGARGPAGGPGREPPRGRGRARPRATRPRASRPRPGDRGTRPPAEGPRLLAPRGRGRVPPGSRPGPQRPHPGRLRDGGRPLPRHALG